MKQTFTFVLLYLITLVGVSAQGLVEYYQAGKQIKTQQKSLLQMRYGPYLAPQWYLMTEGFVRRDNSRLDQSLGGLLTASPVTRVGGSLGVGVTYRNKWALEAGLALSPVHNQARVNTYPPVEIQTRTGKASAFVRGKWALLTTSRQWHRSGFWLNGGAWAVPNSSATAEASAVTGYRYLSYDARSKMTLVSQARPGSGLTALAELGAEYQVRLSPTLDLSLFARGNWGLGEVLTTDVAYHVNNQPIGETVIRARGNGASYGLSVRYVFQRPTANPKSLYQLQGNATK